MHLLLGRSTLPSAFRITFRDLQSHLFLERSILHFASPQTHKMLRGSSDQALWLQAFVVRAFKPAICLQGHPLLGRSSLNVCQPSDP